MFYILRRGSLWCGSLPFSSLCNSHNAKMIQYMAWKLRKIKKKREIKWQTTVQCSGLLQILKRCQTYVYAALNFPINIRRASVFQNGTIVQRQLFFSLSRSLFPLSQSKCGWLPLDKSIGNKQAIKRTHNVWSAVTQWSVTGRQKGTTVMTGLGISHSPARRSLLGTLNALSAYEHALIAQSFLLRSLFRYAGEHKKRRNDVLCETRVHSKQIRLRSAGEELKRKIFWRDYLCEWENLMGADVAAFCTVSLLQIQFSLF